jgi:hypothetical protein
MSSRVSSHFSMQHTVHIHYMYTDVDLCTARESHVRQQQRRILANLCYDTKCISVEGWCYIEMSFFTCHVSLVIVCSSVNAWHEICGWKVKDETMRPAHWTWIAPSSCRAWIMRQVTHDTWIHHPNQHSIRDCDISLPSMWYFTTEVLRNSIANEINISQYGKISIG